VNTRTLGGDGLPLNPENQSLFSAQLATYPGSTSSNTYLQFTVEPSGKPTHRQVVHGAPSDHPVLDAGLASKFFKRLYSSSAVRFGINENLISTNRILAPDAWNHVQVLDLLSTNTSRWQWYFDHIERRQGPFYIRIPSDTDALEACVFYWRQCLLHSTCSVISYARYDMAIGIQRYRHGGVPELATDS